MTPQPRQSEVRRTIESTTGTGMVVAAFPVTGKTWLTARDPMRFRDSDSSRWSRSAAGKRHPQWPSNYLAVIRATVASGAVVLCSTHAEVRAALSEAEVPFALVYPAVSLREEYRARMVSRGSPEALVAKVCDELWDDALADCAAQEGCEHAVLRCGMYLSDVIV